MHLNTIFSQMLESFEYRVESFSKLFELACRLGRLDDMKLCINRYGPSLEQHSQALYPMLARICNCVWEHNPGLPIDEDDLNYLANTREEYCTLNYVLSMTTGNLDRKRFYLTKAYAYDQLNISVIQGLLELDEKVELESLQQLYRIKGLNIPVSYGDEADKHFRFVALGGGDEVGASAYYVEIDHYKILVDFGVKLDGNEATPASLSKLRELCRIEDLDAILITHAHLDHCGALMDLYEACPTIKPVMTPVTKTLMTSNIASGINDNKELTKFQELLDNVFSLDYNVPFVLDNGGLDIEFYVAGHILGAASILIRTKNQTVYFTGDFNLEPQATVGGLEPPKNIPVDIMITENTYGNRFVEYASKNMRFQDLNETVRKAITEGKSVLIPAFALGRAQEVIYGLKDLAKEMKFMVYIDGMANDITHIYNKILKGDLLDTECVHPLGRGYHGAKQTFMDTTFSESPCVVIASSGMLNEGSASYDYAKYMVSNPNTLCILTGYQSPRSFGGQLKGQMDIRGRRYVTIDNQLQPVMFDLKEHSLSSHPSITDIMALATYINPQTLILTHGDATRYQETKVHQALKHVIPGKVIQSFNYKEIEL